MAVGIRHLDSKSGAAVANLSSNAIDIPSGSLITVFVGNRHTTAASLAHGTVSLSGGGMTFVEVPGSTIVFASGTRRLTAYRGRYTGTAPLTSRTVDFTGNGIAQNEIGMFVISHIGVDKSGTSGAGAIANVYVADSGNTNVTSLAVAISNARGNGNGFVACFYNGTTTAVSPKASPAWTEGFDIALNAGRMENQFRLDDDTTANGTFGSGPTAGIVIESKATDTFCPVTRGKWYGNANGGGGTATPGGDTTLTNGAGPMEFVIRAGNVLNILVLGTDDGLAYTPVNGGGVAWHALATLVNSASFRVYWAEHTSDRDIVLSLSLTGAPAGSHVFNASLYYIDGVNLAGGSGTVPGVWQTKSGTGSKPFTVTFDNVLQGEQSNVVAFALGLAIVAAGNQTNAASFTPTNNVSNLVGFAAASRYAGTDAMTINGTNSGGYAMLIMEVEALPPGGADVPPTVNLITPPEGAISAVDQITIDTFDDDGDLAFFAIIATFPNLDISELVYTWSVDGLNLYAASYVVDSTASIITNGIRNVLDRGGWPDTDITITVYAIDAKGNITIETFTWSAPDAVVGIPSTCATSLGDPPTVEFVTPPLGQAVYRFTTVVFDIISPNAALRRYMVRVTFKDRDGWVFAHDGSGFGPDFVGPANSRVFMDDRVRFSLLMDGGWRGQPEITVYAINTVGLEA